MTGWVIVAAVSTGFALACALPPRAVHDRAVVARPGGRSANLSAQGSRALGDLRWMHAALAVAAGAGAALLVGGRIGLPAGVVVCVVAWRLLSGMEPSEVRKRRERLARALPGTVDLLACALAAGASPTGALDRVAGAVDPPMCDELQVIGRRLAFGVDPVRVWTDVGAHPQLGRLGRCVARAIDSGVSVSTAMHRLAEDLRRSTRADVEARARSVGVKAAAPLGVCLLPAFIVVGIVPLVAGSVEVLVGG